MTKNQRAVAASLAEAVKRARADLGWSQGTLAEKLELSTNYVSLLERAERLPSVDVLVRLAQVLGVPVGLLVGQQAGADVDPWLREATALLRAVPEGTRSAVLGMLRGVTAVAGTEGRPEGSGVRSKRRRHG